MILPLWHFLNTSQNNNNMNKLSDEQKQAALEAWKQGMKSAYEKIKNQNLKWWERLGWVILAGAVYAAASLLGGCGHSVDVAQGRTEICKDGSCLVLEPGHLSYSQQQEAKGVPPVVQRRVK